MFRRPSLALAAALLLAATAAFAQSDFVADTTTAAPPDSSAVLPPPAEGAPAATPAAAVTPASLLGPGSPQPTRPHVIVTRADGAIRQERDQMSALAGAADTELLTARKKVVEAKSTVEIKKKEIDMLDARVKAAKQAKDEGTRAAFESERKRQEAMKDYFERAQDVAEAAVEEAQARGGFARAAARAAELEAQIAGRAGIAAFDNDPALYKQEQQYLEAARQRGAAQEKMANKAQDLAGKKLRLYRAWADFLRGK